MDYIYIGTTINYLLDDHLWISEPVASLAGITEMPIQCQMHGAGQWLQDASRH